ncbi:MAG TPA: PIN domain-containing protein [Tepidiformaceae bacterium]|nr:PIN domain-containing protein [Tepidiformaceae bacterium]
MRFVDTNVLIYSISDAPSESVKRVRSDQLLESRDLALSSQVLQEFYTQATRGRPTPLVTHEQAMAYVESLTRFPIQPVTTELVLASIACRARFQISYWDAAIIEAARMLGCAEILSEDLNHGQDYDGVRVVNPFR